MKKAIGMFAALILALGMSGLAYAHWSETLTISGTVNTGNVDVAWSECYSGDNEIEGKDVSSIKCEIDPADPNTLIVTVTNAYPCIGYWNVVDIHCEGSIPVHIYDVVVSNPNPDVVEVDISYYSDYDCTVPIPIESLPVQLHYCEQIYARINVHITQEAEMNAKYEFSAEITAIQWNMGP